MAVKDFHPGPNKAPGAPGQDKTCQEGFFQVIHVRAPSGQTYCRSFFIKSHRELLSQRTKLILISTIESCTVAQSFLSGDSTRVGLCIYNRKTISDLISRSHTELHPCHLFAVPVTSMAAPAAKRSSLRAIFLSRVALFLVRRASNWSAIDFSRAFSAFVL